MKAETLEALLIDRSLGELPAETAELLDAYLGQNPAAATHAERLGRSVRLARQAMKRSEPGSNRTLPPPPWRTMPVPRRLAMTLPPWVKLAACVALGLAVGWLARAPSMTTAAEGRGALAISNGRQAPSASASSWTATRIADATGAAAAADRRRSPYRLRWDSPAQQPHLEEIQ